MCTIVVHQELNIQTTTGLYNFGLEASLPRLVSTLNTAAHVCSVFNVRAVLICDVWLVGRLITFCFKCTMMFYE